MDFPVLQLADLIARQVFSIIKVGLFLRKGVATYICFVVGFPP